MRKSGTIGAPLDAAISLGADGGSESGLAETLKRYREELKDLFIVSDVAIARRCRKQPISGARPTAARISPSMATAASRAPRRIPQSRWSGVTRRVRNARDAGSTSMTAAARPWMRDAARWWERSHWPERIKRQASRQRPPGRRQGERIGRSSAAAQAVSVFVRRGHAAGHRARPGHQAVCAGAHGAVRKHRDHPELSRYHLHAESGRRVQHAGRRARVDPQSVPALDGGAP